MKKLFTIISACICALVLTFILVINFVKVNINIETSKPYQIYVYNKSTVAINSGGYNEGDDKYNDILKALNKTTSISIFKRLVNKTKLNEKIEIDMGGKISKYSTTMKQNHIVVEMIYDKQQDTVAYYEGNSRVVSYYAALYLIRPNNDFFDIIVYYSSTNDTTKKDSYYADCKPLILKGDSRYISEFVYSL